MPGKHEKAASSWRAESGKSRDLWLTNGITPNEGESSPLDDDLLADLRARAENRMTPWQEEWFDQLPTDRERRKSAVYAKILEYRYSDFGPVMIDVDWPYWEALTAEWNRLQHTELAERRRSA